MNIRLRNLFFLTAIGVTTLASAKGKTTEPIIQVPFTQVHFNDNFWTPKIEINRTVSIPSAFKECEKNGRFDNFALAGKLIKGEHKGDFSFDDTDPYKIIEGASYSLAVKYDKKLDAYLDSVINLIRAAQEPDGYLCTCVTNNCTRLSGWWGTHRWERINSHELYNCGHLYEAAVAHYQATGKKTLLNVAIKNADLVCQTFGPNQGQIHRPSGHPIVEMALCKLYKITGNKKYLDMAKYFVEETGRGTDGHRLSEYSQDHMPILKQDEIKGHAVRAGYLYSGVADVASLTKDTAYFNALTRIWDNMAGKKLYITGGIGSRAQGEGFGPNYELNNHTAYCETWAHRGNGEMTVWLPTDLSATRPAMPPTVASESKVSASHNVKSISAINDGLLPKDENDRSIPYYHWWPKQGTTEWISYDFGSPKSVSSSTIYWFDDAPWGGCRVPKSWKIYYKNANNEWTPVENLNAYGVEKGTGNEVRFKKITTQELKLEVKLPEKNASGLYEWEVE